jgi:hypothetical protein
MSYKRKPAIKPSTYHKFNPLAAHSKSGGLKQTKNQIIRLGEIHLLNVPTLGVLTN